MKSVRPYAVFIAILILAACSSQMQPAKQALDSADAAVNAAAADATKYMPELLGPLQTRLTTLHTAFNNHEYSAVLADAPAVQSDAQALAQAATQRKAQTLAALDAQWSGLAASVPSGVQAVQTKVDALSKSKRTPKDIDLPTAKSDLADASSGWSKADAAHTAGNLEEAVNDAKDANGKLVAAASAVKVTLPNAAAPAAPAAQ